MSGVQTIQVTEEDGEQRLDRWLRKRFPHVSQVAIEKLCRTGQLRVDGGRVKGATRVQPGQEIRIPPMPEPGPARERSERPLGPQVNHADEQMIQEAVLWKDDHIIALNKPPGLPSQGGSGLGGRHVDGLTTALMFGYKERPKLVHRLDKDTSGILLLARTDRIARALSEAFRLRSTRKIYWAAVAGVPHPRMGTIRYGLVKGGHRGGDEKMIAVHPRDIDKTEGAKRATTDYAVLDALGTRTSWCALVPITGRTHQLRAHMAELGHPIVGDGKYGGSGQENLGDGWGAQLGGEISKKLHLHARSLTFDHPITKKRITLTAPLAEHMSRTWKSLGWHENDVPADPFAEDE
ncbi:RluA family pseudouridine synthase [Paracoccus sediminilitoris]|uniref:RluA family pseudouridine synthase n=1 Tax=Paracoccus sediminilitoris TaxID=2202419 RepID=UPI000DBA9864|nr:RluA family pseudouridine synthase [Paracoccus sediminilitoris]